MKSQNFLATVVLAAAVCSACSGADDLPGSDTAGFEDSAEVAGEGEGAGSEFDEGFGDESSKTSEDDRIGTLSQPVCEYRGDFVNTTITPSEGFWGNWGQCFEWCHSGSYALFAKLKSETPRGSGDDTGLNAIELTCISSSTGVETNKLYSLQGGWGAWQGRNEDCGNQPIIGAKMMVEPKQGGGDDTAANRVAFKCLNGAWIYPDSYTAWGSWSEAKECPAGSAVCGMRTRVEPSQGSGDDTALNGMELACCRLP
jgi:hypothetical protein